MNRFKTFIRLRIQQKYWTSHDHLNETHLIPNRDLMRHEAVDCPCGPAILLVGATWIHTHYSLDNREVVEEASWISELHNQ